MNTLWLREEWRAEYSKKRYLEHDSLKELNLRHADLAANILTIGGDGSALISERTERFQKLLAHVLAEFALRDLHPPEMLIQKPYRHHRRAAELWSTAVPPEGTYLLKFGRSEHLGPMLKNGSFRIGNAITYNDLLLGPAIADDELTFSNELHGATVHIPANHPRLRNREPIRMETIGNIRRTAECTTDYYFSSFCAKYDLRLFDDLSRDSQSPYDACLAIRNPDRVIDTIRQCVEYELPGWTFCAEHVAYCDPHQPQPGNVDVFFTKHCRYAYQQEFRLVWLPPSARNALTPIHVSLGSLEAYCTLLKL